MAKMSSQEILGAVPGESMTKTKGMLPFERPPTTSSPEEGVQLMFDAITEPKSARKLIKSLEGGVTLEVIVESLLTMARGEGIVSPSAIPIMAPALATIIDGMAKMAGVTAQREPVEDPWTTPDEDEVEVLVSKITGEVFDKVPKESPVEAPIPEGPSEQEEMVGLMKPPAIEGVV